MTKTAQLDAPYLNVRFRHLLHPGQLEVLDDPDRFKVLRAGRRWRKTALGIIQAYTGYRGRDGHEYLGALTGGHIGWWVPSLTARYIVGDWIPIKSIAGQIPGSRIEEANHRVIMPSGGSILVLTGDTIDSGRGLGLDGAVLEEASLLDEQLWTETVRSTLIDRRGWGMFLFTPKGFHFPHDLGEEATARADWREFHFSSLDNPHLSPEELAELTAEMSTLVYKQEILAEYVSGGAGMFDRSWFQYWFESTVGGRPHYQLGEGEAVPVDKCRRFVTVDLAWSLEERADYTVISTWAVTPRRHLILLDVVRDHIAGPDIVKELREINVQYRPGYFLIERATKQLSIVQEATRAGLPVREVRADKDKQARALPATARMEQRTVWFPQPARVKAMRECEAELLAFPMGRHDDFVDTLAYACQELSRPGTQLVGVTV